jgi:hypothetical protein
MALIKDVCGGSLQYEENFSLAIGCRLFVDRPTVAQHDSGVNEE